MSAKRITVLHLGSIPVKVEHDPEMVDCGQYKSAVEGPVISLGPPALEPGTVNYATTVFHEMLHCISDLYGLGLSEGKVRVLEQTIAAQFAQNPEWAKLYFKSVVNPTNKAKTKHD